MNIEFLADPARPQRCCRCGIPPCVNHLGPPGAGDSIARNGMNLVGKILHTIDSSTRPIDYGFVQTVQSRMCLEHFPSVGGGWRAVDERAAGSNDVFDDCATCTTPQDRGGLPEIVFSDSPGFDFATGSRAFGKQLMQKGNFQSWVIARDRTGPWRRISEPFKWHSTSWVRTDLLGNWELKPRENRIASGWTSFAAGCPA